MSYSHLHLQLREDNPIALHSAGQAQYLANTRNDDQWIFAIIIATVTYQALLCLLNTYGFAASRALLGVAEGIILLACVPLIARRLLPGVIVLAALAGAMFCLLTLLSGELNIKNIRDLAIPLAYFWLGCNLGRTELADRALTYAIGLVLFMGCLELFFLDHYTNFFDIFSYYVSTGTLEPITDYVRESKLQLNGTRPEGIGRTLLPDLLGSHRVSSVFLEPVSLGNFATICAAWGLSKTISEFRQMFFFVFAAVVLMVISDSRFALTSVSLMVVMRMLLHGKALYLAIAAPFVAVLLVIYLGIGSGAFSEDNFRGRLALSGHALLEFDVATLFAATVADPYADMGYAHVISSFGLPLTLLLWFSFWYLPFPDESGQRFRAFVSIYITLILCVSGFSLFALKTSGLLWFLVGCSLKNPAPVPKAKTGSNTDPLLLNPHHPIRTPKDAY